jgi:hypothetical protein
MRSIVCVLALATSIAAPLSAVAAATPNTFTSPTSVRHQSKPAEVFMTFRNVSSQDRELVVGGDVYKIRYNSVLSIHLPVGAVVKVYSQTNSKVNGQELMQVAENDRDSTVVLK